VTQTLAELAEACIAKSPSHWHAVRPEPGRRTAYLLQLSAKRPEKISLVIPAPREKGQPREPTPKDGSGGSGPAPLGRPGAG